ncbi:MAG: hypothetical protein HQK59_05960 [Deltaproteobacteria bacterium]|nr:hypothetical protein [Deltaproteobacteria bacterium]MBF0526558.1 hypothetical protein [Deltaproteobacteria bacterium]
MKKQFVRVAVACLLVLLIMPLSFSYGQSSQSFFFNGTGVTSTITCQDSCNVDIKKDVQCKIDITPSGTVWTLNLSIPELGRLETIQSNKDPNVEMLKIGIDAAAGYASVYAMKSETVQAGQQKTTIHMTVDLAKKTAYTLVATENVSGTNKLFFNFMGNLDMQTGGGATALELIAMATKQIKKVNPNAFIYWAGGRNSGEQPIDPTPDKANEWQFYASSTDPNSKGWTLTYTDGQWSIDEQPYPFPGYILEDALIAVKMDVMEAWNLAIKAGHKPAALTWWLDKPMKPNSNFLYGFWANEQDEDTGTFVWVNTVTKAVVVSD